MRKQMREDAKRMVITPKTRRRSSREIDEPPEANLDRCPYLPDDLYKPKNWWRA